jgi:hypothetical protein
MVEIIKDMTMPWWSYHSPSKPPLLSLPAELTMSSTLLSLSAEHEAHSRWPRRRVQRSGQDVPTTSSNASARTDKPRSAPEHRLVPSLLTTSRPLLSHTHKPVHQQPPRHDRSHRRGLPPSSPSTTSATVLSASVTLLLASALCFLCNQACRDRRDVEDTAASSPNLLHYSDVAMVDLPRAPRHLVAPIIMMPSSKLKIEISTEPKLLESL